MSRIFISHAGEDEDVARNIAAKLEAAGYHTWYYERDILPAEDHITQTSRAIENSAAFLIVISNESVNAIQVETELVHAHDSGMVLMPILLDMSYDELKKRKPMWKVAIGASVALPVRANEIEIQLPRILAGLRNLGICPTADSQPKLLLRITGFVSSNDGGFRLERLIRNDIGFGQVGDGISLTIQKACFDTLSILLVKSNPSRRLAEDMVSAWTTNGEEIPGSRGIDLIPSGTVVIVILNERRYPPHVLKTLLLHSKDVLRQ